MLRQKMTSYRFLSMYQKCKPNSEPPLDLGDFQIWNRLFSVTEIWINDSKIPAISTENSQKRQIWIYWVLNQEGKSNEWKSIPINEINQKPGAAVRPSRYHQRKWVNMPARLQNQLMMIIRENQHKCYERFNQEKSQTFLGQPIRSTTKLQHKKHGK